MRVSSKPSAPDPAHLTALTDIILAMVKVVADEYATIGQSVPSLDSIAPGPLDTPEKMSLNLTKAIQIIEAACAQLCFTVSSPGHTVTNVSFSYFNVASTQNASYCQKAFGVSLICCSLIGVHRTASRSWNQHVCSSSPTPRLQTCF